MHFLYFTISNWSKTTQKSLKLHKTCLHQQKFYPTLKSFTQALLVMLVTNIMSALGPFIQCIETFVLVEDGFRYCNCNQCDFEITAMSSLKLYKQVKHKIVSNINETRVVMKQQFLSTNEWATNIGIIYQCTQCDRKLAQKYLLSKHGHLGSDKNVISVTIVESTRVSYPISRPNMVRLNMSATSVITKQFRDMI